MQELSQYNCKIEYRAGKEGGKPDAHTIRGGDLPTAGDNRLTGNLGMILPKEEYWDSPDTEEIKLDVLETTEFRGPRRRGDTEGKQQRRPNPRHQKKLGGRKKRKERNSPGSIPMEGHSLMVSRKDSDTRRSGYQATSGYAPLLSLNTTNPHKRDTAERQRLANS